MKAMVFTQYGSVEKLQIKEVEKPTPNDNEVLIKVKAASINEWDMGLLKGKPFVNRLMLGILKPKKFNIMGSDIAGTIEAAGKNTSQFKVGDEVFGDLSVCHWSGFAEYVTATEKALTLKPANMTFEQAAAIPQAGLLAWQGLCQGGIQESEHQKQYSPKKVLINGASGGTGSFAIQIAKAFGAEVTGVCRTSKMEFVLDLGADYVLDYTKEDFTQNGKTYDIIIDVMAYHPALDYRRSLSPTGHYVMLGGKSALVNKMLLLGIWTSMTSQKKMGLLLLRANKQLDEIITLFEQAKVTPVIDQCFPLSQGVEAFSYYAQGYAKGKIVITME